MISYKSLTIIYRTFYKRYKDKGLTYSSYEEILEINKKSLWKEHPLRQQMRDQE